MRFGLVTAGTGLVLALGLVTAEAAPLAMSAMLQPAVATGGDAQLLLVRQGCGFGEHRDVFGRCRYNRGWRGRVRAHRNWRRGYRYYR